MLAVLCSMSFVCVLTLCHCDSVDAPEILVRSCQDAHGKPHCDASEYAYECTAAGLPTHYVAEEGCELPERRTSNHSCVWREYGTAGCGYVNGLVCCQ